MFGINWDMMALIICGAMIVCVCFYVGVGDKKFVVLSSSKSQSVCHKSSMSDKMRWQIVSMNENGIGKDSKGNRERERGRGRVSGGC